MKIYDISQELLSSSVYPGDPAPKVRKTSDISKGDLYSLTELTMCVHNGTHVDAPSHFIDGAKAIEALDLHRLIGKACVVSFRGILTAQAAKVLLENAEKSDNEAALRLLIKGDATVTTEAAEVLRNHGIYLIGVESQSVGPVEAPMAVHKILLDAEIVLLEGIRLTDVPDGIYLLSCAPISIAGADGSPCRAVLIELD